MQKKKTALITGASSGIGKEFARIHAEQGGDLVVVARREDKLNALKTELENKHGIKVMVIAKDLTLPGATETEFASTSGMDQTSLFDTTASARSVAEDGYNAMLAGKLDVISGVTLTHRMMMAAVPITPKKMLLRQVRRMQEVGV